ncbi:hypothetical protein BaRGS_00040372 [Batillaria attramentaria]|uniref:Uncharacterized protein n=1 Tax=Batillaria attramentaria TaxID=370345 RepID=A0ABD0J0D8_9CAEN
MSYSKSIRCLCRRQILIRRTWGEKNKFSSTVEKIKQGVCTHFDLDGNGGKKKSSKRRSALDPNAYSTKPPRHSPPTLVWRCSGGCSCGRGPLVATCAVNYSSAFRFSITAAPVRQSDLDRPSVSPAL